MSTVETTLLERGFFIEGRSEAPDGELDEIRDPATGELVGRVAVADAVAVDRAVQAAQGAFEEWSRRGVAERGQILIEAAAAFLSNVDQLAPTLVAEQGKTLKEARIELTKAADTLAHYGELGRAVRGVSVHGLAPDVEGRVLRRPLGVVAAIVPWNFPTTLLCNKLGPALLCGNTVVAKPADTTPFTTLAMTQILTEAGLPAGTVNIVTGAGALTGEALVSHPLARKVAFTGSTRTGERVMQLAAVGTKRLTLELGGSDPMIICDDADLGAAASAAAMGRFYNCGQACLAIKRLYVFDSVADEIIETIVAKARKLRVGVGTDLSSQIGPLHTERQRTLLEEQIAASLRGGAELLEVVRGRKIRRSRTAGSMSPPWCWSRRRTPRWRPRRSSGRLCRSGGSVTWRRRSRFRTGHRLASARPSGPGTSGGRSAPRTASNAVTPGSTHRRRSTTSFPSAVSRAPVSARSTASRCSTPTPT